MIRTRRANLATLTLLLTLGAAGQNSGLQNAASVRLGGAYVKLQPRDQVAAPTFSPVAGTYISAQTVTISTTTSGASIRYTTDGSTPSETAGTVYSAPITVGSTMTVKAIAYKTGFTDSSVASATYTVTGSSWYNTSWNNRKAIIIDHTKVSGSSNLSNFPVLVSVTDANLKTTANGGNVGKSDGTDILFTSSDGATKLAHELDSYNASTGQLIAWVSVAISWPVLAL